MKPLTPASPHVIIMVGIPGAGKSTFAERFAETFQAPIVSQSRLQREYGVTDEYAEKLRDAIIDEFMKTNRTFLIDGGTEKRLNRMEMIRKFKKEGYKPLLVWVQTDTQESRWRASKPHPKGSSMDDHAFDATIKLFEAPNAKEHPIVISGKHTYTSQLKIVLRQLASGNHHPSSTTQTPRPQARPRIQ